MAGRTIAPRPRLNYDLRDDGPTLRIAPRAPRRAVLAIGLAALTGVAVGLLVAASLKVMRPEADGLWAEATVERSGWLGAALALPLMWWLAGRPVVADRDAGTLRYTFGLRSVPLEQIRAIRHIYTDRRDPLVDDRDALRAITTDGTDVRLISRRARRPEGPSPEFEALGERLAGFLGVPFERAMNQGRNSGNATEASG